MLKHNQKHMLKHYHKCILYLTNMHSRQWHCGRGAADPCPKF